MDAIEEKRTQAITDVQALRNALQCKAHLDITAGHDCTNCQLYRQTEALITELQATTTLEEVTRVMRDWRHELAELRFVTYCPEYFSNWKNRGMCNCPICTAQKRVLWW